MAAKKKYFERLINQFIRLCQLSIGEPGALEEVKGEINQTLLGVQRFGLFELVLHELFSSSCESPRRTVDQPGIFWQSNFIKRSERWYTPLSEQT